jgi:hypothetical protein
VSVESRCHSPSGTGVADAARGGVRTPGINLNHDGNEIATIRMYRGIRGFKNTPFDVFSARQELNVISSFTDILGISFILHRSNNVFGCPEITLSTYSTYKVDRLLRTFPFSIK